MPLCKISFQGYDWRNEFTVTSPTGKTVMLRCNGKWDRMSPELLALVNRYQYGDIPGTAEAWGTTHEQEIPCAVMREILALIG